MTELTAEEWLLRSFPVPDNRGDGSPIYHFEHSDGKLKVSRGAFNDRNYQPSVDRLNKLGKPEDARFGPSDAVIKLLTTDVIALTKPTRRHYVLDDEKEDRRAHAIVMSDPLIAKTPSSEKRYWKNFQELLAAKASKYGWVIAPVIGQ